MFHLPSCGGRWRSPVAPARVFAIVAMLVVGPFGCADLRSDTPVIGDGAADLAVDGRADAADASAAADGPVADGPVADAGTGMDGAGVPADVGLDSTDGQASPPDGPGNGNPPSRCPAGASLCDGFEQTGLDTGVWNPFSDPGSTITIDTSRAVRGNRSLRLHIEPGFSQAVGLHSGGEAARVTDPAYVRFFVYVPAPDPAFGGARVTVDDNVSQSVSAEWTSSQLSLDGMPAGQGAAQTSFPAHGRWVCLVLQVASGAPGAASLSVDGQSPPALATVLQTAPPFKRLMFVLDPDGSQSQPVDMWIDEVLVSRTPVGCDD